MLDEFVWNQMNQAASNNVRKYPLVEDLLRRLWRDYFNAPLDTLDDYWPTPFGQIRKTFFESDLQHVYTFIEFVANNWLEDAHEGYRQLQRLLFTQSCNAAFEREHVPYRFIGTKLVRLNAEQEMAVIQDALDEAAASDVLRPVHQHLERGVESLNVRAPDYRTCIKEAINAVEALCRLIVRDDKATLGEAVKEMRKANRLGLHSALLTALGNMYGYASDAQGIRHAQLDDSAPDLADATYLLSWCSSTVSFLVAKASKAGLSLESPQ